MTKNPTPENSFFVEEFVLTKLFISHQPVAICHKYYFIYLIPFSPVLQEHTQSSIVLENSTKLPLIVYLEQRHFRAATTNPTTTQQKAFIHFQVRYACCTSKLQVLLLPSNSTQQALGGGGGLFVGFF